ncbi:rhamnulokinase [Caldicoprobacter guelmensis]|uniref:rhamnulokinase n=1 Tax=Caldicoprobacter guelmensis TaxID=1170224 RepID=UPI00195D3540|nr:rhamnulokinase [Caldicoprobacter guelmensis]MBM7581633.1 rhamnulokinase [Caldicoprobacter guelmensis]
MKTLNLLAFDFGASSGRAILGRFDGKKLSIEEIHRFSNDPVKVGGHTYWDVLRLFWEMRQGLLKFAHNVNGTLSSLGIDTWGVDFGLLDSSGELLGNPYHYRDSQTEGMMEKAFAIVPKEKIYEYTGIAFQKFNTIYQLLALKERNSPILEKADTLLFMPDLLAYFLTGEKSTEYTEASTSQLLEARSKTWCTDLIKVLGLPDNIFTSIQQPGTIRGNIASRIAEELNIGRVPVVAVATHDTGSAVVAVPAVEDDYVYLSSGTWSLMGVEVREPIINEQALQWNYTNEGGAENSYRFLKNIMGLWLIQECKRVWDRQGEVYSFAQLEEMARNSEPFKAFIDPDHDDFYAPSDMPQTIQNFCARTGQAVPQTKGEILRCVYESLAMKYRWTIERLEKILNRPLKVLHIVGGGTKDKLLNQFTANAINRLVICGPTEATAIGNLMMQAKALGEVANLREIRQIIRNSFPTVDYMPQDVEAWDEAYERFLKVV